MLSIGQVKVFCVDSPWAKTTTAPVVSLGNNFNVAASRAHLMFFFCFFLILHALAFKFPTLLKDFSYFCVLFLRKLSGSQHCRRCCHLSLMGMLCIDTEYYDIFLFLLQMKINFLMPPPATALI